ncbi:1-acyl-sn-glycerol-3-phosphate acyltransferase [Dyadobacter sp. BE34]|uniref:1-acyl-sn-glycerol-3-phosphate acyltransferase n=1 Tax=Dyadobacter fermentans TaxID=94254 RepID=A0ABU1R374_9BACT|nr:MULTISPECIES: 1-acyl-sn-glycerol-3-phosphate acyltransferase [Dyadobacter]MDR6807826.1 1-acyl-sn-glycerol-3-phosphate acyltransferase [Dyadobacter fermentans]MDR7045567.1 1-acyl-sn-glycerol-3-phosphate acyltransferase [Dyadobacter sp. BE242]MDR7199880.1 1-acyl-sn-glycerol-3-phosphate acyltransferase [Dyadobacter sp. BE34]MDR7217661.1 1-acyl-sn-glycerol-3-phosphate acyltransferase [Dyadobacter sp. BE31]MDR7265771.1 1-acyl-sn-glycerol-3-phosphate acyltransferase [Dyadobacter sp. BE32]
MFYYFSRFLVRLALPIYLRKLCVVHFDKLPKGAPLLLASNHPDSFFDAVVIGSVLEQPIHTLTRGDVFRKKAAAFWLRQINLIPVFRGSEGRQYVKNHDITAQESHDALKKGDAVVVFSEGICVNEWRLRPLGKGTARMAYKIWYGEDALQSMKVIPTGLNYENFRGPGKRVSLNFGEAIAADDIQTSPQEYEKWLREFNEILDRKMNAEILTVHADLPKAEQQRQLNAFFDKCATPKAKSNPLLGAIGWIGRMIHLPLYSFFEKKAAKLTARSVFYDSVLFGMLLYLYPVIVGLLSIIVAAFAGWEVGLGTFIGLPLLAWVGSKW